MNCRQKVKIRPAVRWCAALLIVFSVIFAGCGKDSAKPASFSAPEDLNAPEYIIGVPQGTAAMFAAEKFYDKAKIEYFDSLHNAYIAVQQKKISALVFDRYNMEYLVRNNPQLTLLSRDIADEHIVVGMPLKHKELCNEINQFIRQYRADGSYAGMYRRWLTESAPVVPDIPAPTAPTRQLKIATEGLNQPMNYYDQNGKLTGFDIEFIRRLALFLNAEIKLETMNFDGLIPAAESGRIDLLIANLNATDERRERMLLSDDYLDSTIAVLVHTDNATVKPAPIHSLADLKGKVAAYNAGSAIQTMTEPLQDGIEYAVYNDTGLAVQAMRTGKADAVLLDEPVARRYAALIPGLHVAVYMDDYYALALAKGSPLTQKINAVLQEMQKSGELKRLAEKWCDGDPDALANDWLEAPATGPNGVLRFAAPLDLEPMCYAGEGGKEIGLDIELVKRVAGKLGMGFEFLPVDAGARVEAVESGKSDVSGGAVSITDERRQKVDFTMPYYQGGLSILSRDVVAEESPDRITSTAQLKGKKVGVVVSSASEHVLKEKMPGAVAVYFNTIPELPLALDTGKIDAFLMDTPQARMIQRKNPGLTSLPEKLSNDEYAFVFPPDSQKLCDAFSGEIIKMKESGELKELDKKWFSPSPDTPAVPPPPQSPPNGTLKCAVMPQIEPFAFVCDNQIIGYDIEVVTLAAGRLGYAIELVPMEVSGYIEAIASGKTDMGVGCITVTEERKEKLLFAEPDYNGGLDVVVKARVGNGDSPSASGLDSFWSGLKSSFERTFMRENRWKLIAQGLTVTIVITILAAIVGTVLAFPLCFMCRSRRRLTRWLGKSYVSLLQGTPILVILMILYYVIFAKVDIEAVLVAVIGFGLNFAAYAGEMLRSGIDAVPRGQVEAAQALGFSPAQTFIKVVLPQAMRHVLPIYRGEFINMLKSTSIVGYIAIQDLTKMSDIIRSRTYEAFFPLIATAIIYFAVAWILASGLAFIEHRLDPRSRRKASPGGVQK